MKKTVTTIIFISLVFFVLLLINIPASILFLGFLIPFSLKDKLNGWWLALAFVLPGINPFKEAVLEVFLVGVSIGGIAGLIGKFSKDRKKKNEN